MKNKKAAMEMSVGTIVTIVLLMSVLVLGLFLVKNIFSSAKNAVDLTDQQLTSEIEKLFSEESKLVIYPTTRLVTLKHGDLGGVGVGIKNLLQGVSGTQKFSYEVVISSPGECGTEDQLKKWFKQGASEKDIPIAVGEMAAQKVLFQIPTGSPICTARFRVNVYVDGKAYATDFFDITTKA